MTPSAAVDVGLAIFVKTPGYSDIKTRLAATIGEDAATRFHTMSAEAVAAVAGQAAQAVPLQPYWAVAEDEALDDPAWNSLPRIAQGSDDLGARMRTVCDTMLQTHGRALLLGADAPQVQIGDLRDAVAALDAHEHVLGPAADGGFWLFGTRRPIADAAWDTTPWSRPRTMEHFVAHLARPVARLRTLRDVDTDDDLAPLLTALAALDAALPEQAHLADWLSDRCD